MIPDSIQRGSAVFANIDGETLPMDLVASVGVFNVKRATCIPYCVFCDGYTSITLSPSSFTINVSQQQQMTVNGTFHNEHNGQSSTLHPTADSWSTSNSSVGTVCCGGLVTAAGAGSTTIKATLEATPDGGRSTSCDYQCPVDIQYQPQATGNMKPAISGPNTVWWFGGQNPNPTSYPISVTLSSSGGASTTWAATAGASKVTLSATTGAQITVSSSGTAFSAGVGDITITATTNSQTSSPFGLTTRRPSKLAPNGAATTECDPDFGYFTFLHYTIFDQLNAQMTAQLPWNEHFTTALNNDNGSNWASFSVSEMGGTAPDLIDQISGVGVNNTNPVPVPTPTCNAGGTQRLEYWGQEFRIGSTTVGLGARVQADSLTRYVDHGAHLGIVTPDP